MLCCVLCSLWFWAALLLAAALYGAYLINPFPGGYRKPSRSPVPAGAQIEFTGRVIPCTDPATGEVLGEDIAATPEEVNEAVKRAKAAQKDWATAPMSERKALLYDIMQLVVERQEEIAKLSVTDTGKTMMEAYYGEVLTTCEKLRHIIAYGADALKTEYRHVPIMLCTKTGRVEYHPMGVIGIIIPWNYPFHNAVSAIAAAVFSGNAAVVKVSEWATKSRQPYVDMLREVVAKRGYNPDLIQLIPGYGDTGAALCKCPDVDKILFIGSPETGKRVMAAASEQLTPVVLELGGKDPLIILEDAEWDHAVDVALRGAFVNCGQNCLAAERIFVQASVYDKFCSDVERAVRNMRQGPPPAKIHGIATKDMVDVGAMTMPGQVEKVLALVDDAVKNGAKILAGGHAADHLAKCKETNTWFYPPTVVVNVNDNMRIVKEELFGPVMVVLKFETDEEVVARANESDYGLGCSIMSNDYKRAEAMGNRIVSGMCTINDFGVSYLIQSLPFGGAKVSGYGRFNGVEGLREFSRQKTVVSDRFPIRSKAPAFSRYPVPSNAPVVISSAVTMLYSGCVKAKLSAVFTFAKNLMNLQTPKFD
mmetsp:Transcript_21882/g.85767  ORF Transcript_21882/g.85767 Transcript_21882/m.85767 type:complete len:592 (-) Transcript_21882:22-1797(-)